MISWPKRESRKETECSGITRSWQISGRLKSLGRIKFSRQWCRLQFCAESPTFTLISSIETFRQSSPEFRQNCRKSIRTESEPFRLQFFSSSSSNNLDAENPHTLIALHWNRCRRCDDKGMGFHLIRLFINGNDTFSLEDTKDYIHRHCARWNFSLQPPTD